MRIGPYETGRVYEGDCLELMKAIPDGAVDAVVTDPPYGIGMDGGRIGSAEYTKKSWDSCAADIGFILQMGSPTIIWGGNYFDVPPSSCWLVWDKKNDPTTFADCELAWTNLAGAVRVFRWLWSGPYQEKREQRWHPTQKPVALMRWCVEKTTGVVLDPFAGSGTTGVACVELGREFLGFEIDPEYCRLANDRIEAARKGISLREHRAGQKTLFEEEA